MRKNNKQFPSSTCDHGVNDWSVWVDKWNKYIMSGLLLIVINNDKQWWIHMYIYIYIYIYILTG